MCCFGWLHRARKCLARPKVVLIVFYVGSRNLVNEATLASGHGRLRIADGQTVDIGGSTGGTSRVVIDGYTAPKIRC